MTKIKTLAVLSVVCFLAGCASSPREITDYKFIKGGEYQGKADNNRPEEIKYQKLPDDIQYVRVKDSLVIATYNKLKADLSSDEGNLKIADYLFLMPGTWEMIARTGQNKNFNKRKYTFTASTQKEKFKFTYVIPKTEKSARHAWEAVKREIRHPDIYSPYADEATKNMVSEIRIRAISTQEMQTLAYLCPFKMVEPLFVVNDKYLLGFNKEGKLEVLDEIPYYIPFSEKMNEAKVEYLRQKAEYEKQKAAQGK